MFEENDRSFPYPFKCFVDKPYHTLFLFFRRSITAGGRLSTAKTRCGTWPKWWDPSLQCQWTVSLPLNFFCRTLEAVACFQQASTERTVMHLCFSFFLFLLFYCFLDYTCIHAVQLCEAECISVRFDVPPWWWIICEHFNHFKYDPSYLKEKKVKCATFVFVFFIIFFITL